MDIQLTEEQELLRGSVERFLNDRYGFETRRKIVASDEGWSRTHWLDLAELGLLAAPFSEANDGLGGGTLATMIIMRELGRRLVVEPFFETVVLAGGLIEAAGTTEQCQKHLSSIMAGRSIWALALGEEQSRYDLSSVATTAIWRGDHYVLSGTKTAVVAAPWADHFVISARTWGAQRDQVGVSLFVVDRRSANLQLRSFKTIDGRRAADISLDGVKVSSDQVLGREGLGVPLLENCRERAIAALCAETLGAMSELNSATLDYAKIRKQFGTTLGSFQVLQHRMVDCFIALEEATSMTQYLTLGLANGEAQISKIASGAKAKVGQAAKYVAEQAVQIHGGMGMTDELNIGHYFKRIVSLNIQFGDPVYHLARYAQHEQSLDV